MTDEEIKKALECCAYNDDCESCPRSKYCDGVEQMIHALDLINRQQAEIERLKYLLEREEKATESFSKKCYKDGIKEFAERFIDEECAYCSSESDEMIFFKERFDNLLAEMVGGENA